MKGYYVRGRCMAAEYPLLECVSKKGMGRKCYTCIAYKRTYYKKGTHEAVKERVRWRNIGG